MSPTSRPPNAIELHAQAVHDAFEQFGTHVDAAISNAMMRTQRCIAKVSSAAARLADRLSAEVQLQAQSRKSQLPSMAFAVGCIFSLCHHM